MNENWGFKSIIYWKVFIMRWQHQRHHHCASSEDSHRTLPGPSRTPHPSRWVRIANKIQLIQPDRKLSTNALNWVPIKILYFDCALIIKQI